MCHEKRIFIQIDDTRSTSSDKTSNSRCFCSAIIYSVRIGFSVMERKHRWREDDVKPPDDRDMLCNLVIRPIGKKITCRPKLKQHSDDMANLTKKE